MKQILFPFFLLCMVVTHAQLNNSWIDYSKTYYKFKVVKSGLCRIGQPALATAGLGNISAEQFQLWRNGEQVRLFTSTPSGILSASDYIEFLGKQNDGKPDKALYRDTTFQLSDNFSLFSDTATYFLTVNATNNNLRFTNAVNNVAANTLSAEPYFMRSINTPFNNQYNLGYAQNVGEYIYSSSYDVAEGFSSATINPCCDLVQNFTGLNVYTGASAAAAVSFYITAAGTAFNQRNLQVKLNNTVLFNEVSMDNFNLAKKQVNNIPLSILQNTNSLTVAVNAVAPAGGVATANDRIVVGQINFSYPSLFNFNHATLFNFELPASAAGNFLVIDNFNVGAVPPVLYSFSDGLRFVADQSQAGKLQFALPGSPIDARKFCLVNEEAANTIAINTLVAKSFINFAAVANQGDYIIISHPYLFNDGNGVNYVDQYKQYRASVAGGAFHPIIIPIDELNDQFAFGIKKHPAAIRDFIRFANQQFSKAPKYIFIIGRGMSAVDYKQNETDPVTDKIDLVQSFGWPASDVLLACNPGTNAPIVPIGRLAAITGTEVKFYLNKVKQYEQAQSSPSQTIADKSWMKNIINVAGGKDNDETNSFVSYLDGYKNIVKDSAFGGYVETFVKASSSAVEQASGARIKELIDGGVSVIQYFGHSSANTLAFNLDDPGIYTNQGRYPFFNISGCSAGNFYIFDPARLTGSLTLSEKYILADQKGGIGFIASTYLGIPPFLDLFNTKLYTGLSTTMYGNSIGNQLKKNLELLGGNAPFLNFFTRIHLEQLNLHGDPAIRINAFTLPDFVVEDPQVKISPAIISVADNSFSLSIKMLNIGKVVKDSIRIYVTRQLPDNSIKILYNKKIPAIKYADSLSFVVPVNPTTDKGLNIISITLDADNVVTELSKANNTLTKQFYILEDEIRPVFPYNYSIVNKQQISFTASTANPLIAQRQYLMELDTTALFNSAFKKQYYFNGMGGVINFGSPNINFKDSTVYYWRTAIVPINGALQIWNMFSFIYLPNSGTGFNQSHYFQQTANTFSNTISLDSDRVYRFKPISRALTINTGLYPYTTYDRINVNLDFDQLASYGCKYGSLQFLVYDSITLQPWANYNSLDPVTGNTTGRFGSYPICNKPTRNFFEFPYNDINYRKKAMDFMDSIPAGMYVSISNLGWIQNTSFISDWQADQLTLGTGNSLYHKLKAAGFSELDSFTHNLPFVFFYKKNTPQFIPQQKIGVLETDLLAAVYTLNTRYNSGTVTSPVFGPARNWTALHWNAKPANQTSQHAAGVQVIGVTTTGAETLLATVAPATDTALNFISAAAYPFIRLNLLNNDSITQIPNQLRYWTVNADDVPEGAVAPNLVYHMKDTVEQGATVNFALAFKNVGVVAFDSLKVKLMITDKANVPHTIPMAKIKALISGDTAVIKYAIDTRAYPGNNTLYVVVNPDNEVPEQYQYNNFIYKNFYVREDKINPLLEVTFDGVHILNKDIVASRPHVLVKLKDESHFLALNDTSLIKVRVLYPDGSMHNYAFSDSMRFTPANLSSGENAATIDFTPYFAVDGDYQLIVSGKDVMGNTAGNLEYRVAFSVINKPMISNLLNYPNPFTTSTAFVFTVTGSVVPQNMRIQILTITGKIVREITKAELGAIHVGRNITDFKWDGTDAFGQKLANGVYLYHVITNLNGRALDKYKADGDNTDQYFNNGYGKMYLMR